MYKHECENTEDNFIQCDNDCFLALQNLCPISTLTVYLSQLSGVLRREKMKPMKDPLAPLDEV